MSSTNKSCGNALRQFVDKVKTSNIVTKQNELQEIISGPLSLSREKTVILETDEAIAVLSRIDPEYNTELRKNVEGIFYEEIERANVILDDLDLNLTELQTLLDGFLQRIQIDYQKCQNSPLALSCYEDARSVLVFLRLRTNLLRLKCSVPLDESLHSEQACSTFEFEDGDFLYRLGKLEVSSSILETQGGQ